MSLSLRATFLLFALGPVLPAEEWFVAPDGDDRWSGRLSAPDGTHGDGPFATLARAQQAVRAAREHASGARTVQVHGGRYELTAPMEFTPADSGTAEQPVTWRAVTGETPVLSGGVRLSGFTRDAKGRWTLTLPAVQRGEWAFNQLWVDGGRRYRPRLPRDTYHVIEAELAPSPAAMGKGFDRFRYHDGDLDPNWRNQGDIEVLAFHQWEMSRLRVQSIDAATRTLQFTGHTICAEPWTGLRTGWRYLLENVAEALDTPGEWYLDRPSGTLTYIPLPGEDLASAEVIAPRCDQLLRIAGDAAHGRFVEHLHFAGLTFAHTAWTLKPEGYSYYQAEMIIPATVVASGLRDASFSDCTIIHTGGYGLELGAGCKRTTLRACVFTDLSAGGIKIGEGAVHEDDAQVASHNTIDNCLILAGGRVHPAGIGIWIGQSHDNRVTHCEVADFYYSAVSLGWTWGYGPSNGHHNTVAWCHLHHLGQGVLSDMGGIYNLGVSPGTTFHHNLIHDVESFSYGGWGLYTDEGSSGVTMEDNLVHHTSSSGFHQHYGRDNVIRNNIFAYGREAQVMRTRDEDHLSFTLERNILLAHAAPLLGGNWNGDGHRFALDRNVYWDEDGSVDFAGRSLTEWRKKGIDAGSVVADPQFTAPAAGDFSLKAGSPALALGFQPLDLRSAGIQPSAGTPALSRFPAAERAGQPLRRAFPPKPSPPPPAAIHDGFEETQVGQKAVGAVTSEDAAVPGATIRVVDDLAASGRHSLAFSDAPGQRNGFDPHLYYEPHFTTGPIEARFAVRLDPGAVLVHEWRTSGQPYHSGPSLRIDGEGRLTVAGRELLRIPSAQWATLTVSCRLGPEATGTWTLAVSLPGTLVPQCFSDLPCSGDFRSLDWLGFISDATQATRFRIDDLSVGPPR